jgi:hypothetical protein
VAVVAVAVIAISVVAVAVIGVPVPAVVASSVIPVIPGASAYENAADKIARSVVAIGRTRVGIIAVVPVRTNWRCSVSRAVVIGVVVVIGVSAV